MTEEKTTTDIYRTERAAALADTLRPGGLALTKRALDFCAFPKGAKLLDVGCGAGASLAEARGRGLDCLGVDASAPLLAAARERGLSAFVQCARAESLPFDDASFDGALLECCLTAMEKRLPALAESRRVLKPGGKLLLSDVFAPVSPGAEAGPLPIGADWAREGFEIQLLEDHTGALRSFFAQMVFELGRAGAEAAFGCAGVPAKELRYLLLVLEKAP